MAPGEPPRTASAGPSPSTSPNGLPIAAVPRPSGRGALPLRSPGSHPARPVHTSERPRPARYRDIHLPSVLLHPHLTPCPPRAGTPAPHPTPCVAAAEARPTPRSAWRAERNTHKASSPRNSNNSPSHSGTELRITSANRRARADAASSPCSCVCTRCTRAYPQRDAARLKDTRADQQQASGDRTARPT